MAVMVENPEMTPILPEIHLARHGETAWSRTGQHTGLTDLPLTERGERNARDLAQRLAGVAVSGVLTSPLRRAADTARIAGFGATAVVDPDLVEWDYGDYEGLTTTEILARRADWDLFRDGCPGGESPAEVGARADAVVRRLRAADASLLVFSSGPILRVLAARWLGLPPAAARHFLLGTASLSTLGYEHTPAQPVLRLWNDVRHVSA